MKPRLVWLFVAWLVASGFGRAVVLDARPEIPVDGVADFVPAELAGVLRNGCDTAAPRDWTAMSAAMMTAAGRTLLCPDR